MSGLFSIFNISTRGMSTQQKAIHVTSHNISNANTEGYSRQRATIETTRPFGMPSLNNAVGPGQLGTGSQVSAIQRVRDTFLDYQIRTETSRYGQFAGKNQFLSEIESIINEPSETGISNLVGKFFDAWQTLAGDPQSSNTRTIVAQQSATLADALNHTSNQLEKLKTNVNQVINNTVFEVNDILDQIDQLNQQIIGVSITGQRPNDLMDRRDSLVETLSTKFNLDKTNMRFDGYDIKQEDVVIPTPAQNIPYLIKSKDNEDVCRLSYVKDIKDNGNGTYDITYSKLGDTAKEATATVSLDAAGYESLSKSRVVWANTDGEIIKDAAGKAVVFAPKDGELFGYAEVQKDIESYENQLDQLARALAFSVNAVHSGKTDASADTDPFFINGDPTSATGEAGIKASNIKINKKYIDNVMLINAKYDSTYGDNDGRRALAIGQLRDKLINIQNIGVGTNGIYTRADMFNPTKGDNTYTENNGVIEFGSSEKGMKIDNYFKDIIAKLGVQRGEAKRMVTNQETLLASFQETREGISGVSLDEEMANLIQYQHAYQANAKVVSTVDELLDVVINGLKR